jgi:hypothetical protein
MGKKEDVATLAKQTARTAALDRIGSAAEMEALKEGKGADAGRLAALEARAKYEAQPKLTAVAIDRLFKRDQEIKVAKYAAEKNALAAGKTPEEAIREGNMASGAVAAAHKKSDTHKGFIALAVVAAIVIGFIAIANSGSSKPKTNSVAIDSLVCQVVDGSLHDVQTALNGLNTTVTAEDAAKTLKGASDTWSGQATLVSGAAQFWLNSMSDLALQLRVKILNNDATGFTGLMTSFAGETLKDLTYCPTR